MKPALFISLPIGFLFCTSLSPATEPQSSAKGIRYFEKHVRPFLVTNCYRCHGPEKQRGNLRLDIGLRTRRSPSTGKLLIFPGHAKKSPLIEAILYQNEDLQMPPKGMLKNAEIARLIRWVEMGAPYPKEFQTRNGKPQKHHWAFQTPKNPPIPKVQNQDWPNSALDHFILAKLEAKSLQPAPPAERRTLIRRATFDLLGLPPSIAEVNAFLQDKSPNAFAKVVDRLLGSPHYGERWGRHWLDVARYADSNGLDENVAYGNAWRYRDYVVNAFNSDKPYDRFLLEQLAGDLLPAKDTATRHHQLIATGFLALGPKVLAEVDEKKMEMDILDEQIDTVGRALMGLTLGCARCHDHKFDPVTMKDYYGLIGIFQSTKTMENFKKIARWHENSLKTPKLREKEQAYLKKKSTLEMEIQVLEKLAAASKTNQTKFTPKIKRLRIQLAELPKPAIPSALGVTEGKTTEAVLLLRGNHLTPGERVSRQLPGFLCNGKQEPFPVTQSGRLRLAKWLIQPDQPLTARVMVNRIWRWHFGQGIVRSTDNFGRKGEPPSNQKLLDWLTIRFVKDGWSIKKLHRLIMLSSTYRMSSSHDAEAKQTDPENRLHWRTNIRRLEAEAIRDSILAVSGLLDRKFGGSLLTTENRKHIFDHTSKDGTKYNNFRRSIYQPVVRNNLYDVFQLFDTTDGTVPNGNREATTVPTQALFFLNSDLVMKASKKLAEDLLRRKGLPDEEAKIRFLYQKAFGRLPTSPEVVRFSGGLAELRRSLSSSSNRSAWALMCQVVFSSNEFIYVQ